MVKEHTKNKIKLGLYIILFIISALFNAGFIIVWVTTGWLYILPFLMMILFMFVCLKEIKNKVKLTKV
jgi:hypothetical protein